MRGTLERGGMDRGIGLWWFAVIVLCTGCESAQVIAPLAEGGPAEPAGRQMITAIELQAEPESGMLTVRDSLTHAIRMAAAAEEPITLTTEHVDISVSCSGCGDGVLDNQSIQVRFEIRPQVESLKDIRVIPTRCDNCNVVSIDPSSLAGPVAAGEHFTISFTVNALEDEPFEFRFQVTAVPVKPCRVRVWFNAFIHRAHPVVAGNVPSGPFAGSSYLDTPLTPPGSAVDVVAWLTDQRGFSSNVNASARTHSEAIFEVKESGTPTMRPAGGFHTTNRTIALEKFFWTPICQIFPSTTGLAWTPVGSSGSTTMVRLTGSTKDPCLELVPFLVPFIDVNGTLSVTNNRTAAGTVTIEFTGMVDEFPSFEMYASDGGVTGSLILGVSNFSNGLLRLAGGAVVPVAGTQTVNCPL